MGLGVTLAAAVAIAWFTLGPGELGPPAATGSEYLLTDLVLNVLLFVPLGVGLALAGVRSWKVVAIGTLASAAIELTQLWWIPGRTASLHDVITNGLGAGLGASLVLAWGERERWRRALGMPFAAALVAAWVIGGLLVVPSFPSGELWYGFWAHEFAGTELFPGRVLSFSVQGLPMPDGPITDTPSLRDRLVRADTIQMVTDVVAGGPIKGKAQIVGVISASGEELASLWQAGTSILARQRLRLSDLSIRTLWLRMDDALPEAPGDTLHLVFRATRQSLELRVEHNGNSKVSRLRLSPEIFWTGFLPFEYEADGGIPWWPLSGVVLIFLVLGLLIAPHRIAAIAALALTLLIGPLTGRTALPGLETVLAALGGMGVGWWLVLHQRYTPATLPRTGADTRSQRVG